MIGQSELSEYVRLKAEVEERKERMDALHARFIEGWRANEERQEGRLILKVSINDEAEKTAWKPVVERIKELHPDMAGAIAGIEKANTKAAPYEQVRVVARE